MDGAPLKQRILMGVLTFFVAIYVTGAFFSALFGVYAFTIYVTHFVGLGFNFSLAQMLTEMDVDAGAAMTRMMFAALIFGGPAGLACLVLTLKGYNVFSPRNWLGRKP